MLETHSEAREIAIDKLLSLEPAVTTRGCWLWAGKLRDGYGRIEFVYAGRLRRFTVHRLSYEYYKGRRTPGLLLRHTCDVRHCWNPDHLIEGTAKQNAQDMMDRGRGRWQQCKEEPIVVKKTIQAPMVRSDLAQTVLNNVKQRRHELRMQIYEQKEIYRQPIESGFREVDRTPRHESQTDADRAPDVPLKAGSRTSEQESAKGISTVEMTIRKGLAA